jgi:2'-5' RNA ligase
MGAMSSNVVSISQEGKLRTLASALIERFRFARQAGITFGGLRDEYEIFGYDREITLKAYRDEYARGGIAKRIVHAFPMATWRGSMELIEDESKPDYTPFEQAWVDLEKKFKLMAVLRRLDILAGLSHYSALLIGAPGELNTELPKGKPDKLLYFTPFPGGGGPNAPAATAAGNLEYADASIAELETDPKNERFGLPKYYNIRRIDVNDPGFQRPVHWSRVIHVAEGCLDNDLYGQPTLEAVWNLLIDLRKVTGGGAEAFFQRANQGMNLNLDKDVELDTGASDKLKDEVEEYMHKISRVLKTRGMDVKMLGSDVADFANPADAILTQIAGTTSIPKRILTGSEMGELASSQDRDNWKDQINGRQETHAGPYIVRPLVDRLIAYGYLPTPKKGPDAYTVVWPHIQTLTDQEKAEGASKWFGMNTGPVPTFTVAEIRDKWYGMAPLEKEQLEEEIELRQLLAPPAPAAPGMPPGAPASEDPEDIDTDGLVDALMDDSPDAEEEDDPEATPALKAAGGPGSGVVGHQTAGQLPVGGLNPQQSEQVARYMPAITAVVRKGGGSLKKSKQQVKAELEHKDEMKAASTMRKLELSLKAKGFTPALDDKKKPIDGVFVDKDGRKATLRMVGKKLSLAITKKPKKQAEKEELKDAEGYKYSSVQVNMPPSIASRMLAFGEAIPDSELASDGRETTPHVTVLYGIHTSKASELYEVLDDIPGPVSLRLGELDCFEGEEHDVIVVKIYSPDLHMLNGRLRQDLEFTNNYPDYVPHATLAYVKPGVGARYVGMKTFEGLGFDTTSLVFSPKKGDDIVVDLGLRAAMASLIDEDSETLRVLTDAISAQNYEVIHEILGQQLSGATE